MLQAADRGMRYGEGDRDIERCGDERMDRDGRDGDGRYRRFGGRYKLSRLAFFSSSDGWAVSAASQLHLLLQRAAVAAPFRAVTLHLIATHSVSSHCSIMAMPWLGCPFCSGFMTRRERREGGMHFLSAS